MLQNNETSENGSPTIDQKLVSHSESNTSIPLDENQSTKSPPSNVSSWLTTRFETTNATDEMIENDNKENDRSLISLPELNVSNPLKSPVNHSTESSLNEVSSTRSSRIESISVTNATIENETEVDNRGLLSSLGSNVSKGFNGFANESTKAPKNLLSSVVTSTTENMNVTEIEQPEKVDIGALKKVLGLLMNTISKKNQGIQ